MHRPRLADCGEGRVDLSLLLAALSRFLNNVATICQCGESSEAWRSVRSNQRPAQRQLRLFYGLMISCETDGYESKPSSKGRSRITAGEKPHSYRRQRTERIAIYGCSYLWRSGVPVPSRLRNA